MILSFYTVLATSVMPWADFGNIDILTGELNMIVAEI